MKKLLALLSCITLVFSYVPDICAEGKYVTIYNEDFSEYKTGELLKGKDNWSEIEMGGSGGNNLVYSIDTINGNKAMKISPSGLGTNRIRISKKLKRSLYGKVNVSFKVKRTTANANFYFEMFDENQERFARMYYDNSKQRMYIKYRNDSGEEVSDGGRVTEFGNDWKNIDFILDFDNTTLSTSYGKEITALKKSLSLSEMRFYNDGYEPEGDIYIDDINVENYRETTTDKVIIYGNERVYGRKSLDTAFDYYAKATDANGKETAADFEWYGKNLPDTVEIDKTNGKITVHGDVNGEKIFAIGVIDCISGISFEKEVALLPQSVYNKDKRRIEIVKTAIDNVLEYGKDIYNNSPLLADGYDTVNNTPAIWRLPDGTEIAMSNLANQSNLMMSMYALSALTGDEMYKNRVKDIYGYFMSNLINPGNSLPFWGGHATVDLKDMQKKGHEGAIYHELKNHMPFYRPFFDINPNKASDIIKGIWDAHISDWSTLLFNRHGRYSKASTASKTWDNLSIYDKSTEGVLIKSRQELPFRNAANDLLHACIELYRNTGDSKSLVWAERLLGRYNALADKNTKIGAYQFAQPEMVEDPMKVLEPIGQWNKIYPTPEEYTLSRYGDRAKNQFEQQFVDEGIITEDEREKIREAYFIGNGLMYRDAPMQDFRLAEVIGTNTDEAQAILEPVLQGMAGYARYAYLPETNQFKYILSSGLDLTGYTFKTGGYYGNIGKGFGLANADIAFMVSYARACSFCKGNERLSDDYEQLWSVVRGIGKAYNLGDFGDKNTAAEFNMETDCCEPSAIAALISVYRATDNRDYLNLARRIADNIIDKNFDGRFFSSSSDNRYIRFSDNYCYMILLLEAEINGMREEMIPFELCEPYFQSDIMYDNGSIGSKRNDADVFWNIKKPKSLPVDGADYMNEHFSAPKNTVMTNYSNAEAQWSLVDSSEKTVKTDNSFAAVISEDINAGIADNVLELKRNVTSSQPAVRRLKAVFNENANNLDDKVYLSMRIKRQKVNTSMNLFVNDTNNMHIIEMSFPVTGQMEFKSGSDKIKRKSTENVIDGEWMKLIIEADVKFGVYNVYINGNRVNTAEIDFLSHTNAGIGSLLLDFSRTVYDKESIVLIDDLCVCTKESSVFAMIDKAFVKGSSVTMKKLKQFDSGARIYIACYDKNGSLCSVSKTDKNTDCERSFKISIPNVQCDVIKEYAFEQGTLRPLMKVYQNGGLS